MKYIVVFFSQSGAIKFNKSMEKKGIDCILAPTPRRLSSSCGTCAQISYDNDVNDLVDDEVESIYLIKNSIDYSLIYDSYDI